LDSGRHARDQKPRAADAASSAIRLSEHSGVFRRVYWLERDQLRRHLLRLSPDDRQLRFGASVSDRFITDYCARRDWRRDSVLGCWIDGELRAVAELKPIDHAWFGEAEVSLSVEAPWQNHDIGTELLRRLAIIARNRLITSLYLICLPRNAKLMHLLRKLDAEFAFGVSEAEARLVLGSPTQLTIMLELLDETSSMLGGLASEAHPLPAVSSARSEGS